MKNTFLLAVLLFSFFSSKAGSQNYVWANAVGSANGDITTSIKVNAAGNVYVAGYFAGTADFDPDAATNNLTPVGGSGSDIFFSKYNNSGKLLWVKNVGSSGSDVCTAMILDVDGNIYLTGQINGTCDFDPGAGIANLTGSLDVFIAKYDSNGNYIWAKSFGAANNDKGTGLVIDVTNARLYITGYYADMVDFDPGAGIFNLTSVGSSFDAFVAKFDTAGNFSTAISIGGSTSDEGTSIGTDDSSNIFVAGYFYGTADFDPSAAMANLASSSNSRDIFIAKYDGNLNYISAFKIGDTGLDHPNSLVVDLGEVYVTGYYSLNPDFSPGADTVYLTNMGNQDAFIAKYDNALNYLWTKNIGGTGNENGKALSIDVDGNILVAGDLGSDVDMNPGASGYPLSYSDGATFFAKYDYNGNFILAKNMIANGQMTCIGSDVLGDIYVGGGFNNSGDFDPGANTSTLTAVSSSDIFFGKYKDCVDMSVTCFLQNVTCNGGNNGLIDCSIFGGDVPHSYLWSNGEMTEDIDTLTAGTYTITVTDDNNSGCSVISSYPISEPNVINIISSQKNIACFGGNDGYIDITVSGGNTGYAYLWNGGSTNEDTAWLTTGIYTVVVTDDSSCTATDTFFISEPSVLDLSYSQIEVSCNGGNNGSIDLTIIGGSPNYYYSWNNGEITEDIDTLMAGTFIVVVTDDSSCTVTDTMMITEPTKLILSHSKKNVKCFGGNDGSVDLTATGGTPGYTFSWNDGSNTEDINTLDTGIYIVAVTDVKNCIAKDTVMISEPSKISSSHSQVDVQCFGGNDGSVDLIVSGGSPNYSFSWNSGDVTEDINTLTAGTYIVNIIDDSSCTVTDTVMITEPAQLTLSHTQTNVQCFGGNDGSVDLTVNGGVGGYTFSWDNGAGTEDINTLDTGIYIVSVTDVNNCSAKDTAMITEPTQLTLNHTQIDVRCFGGSDGSIDVTITGGTPTYTFSWSNGAGTEDISGLDTGVYDLLVTDLNNCITSGSTTISQPQDLSLNFVKTYVSCSGKNDGAIDLTVSGGTPGYTFNWSNSAITEDIMGLNAGNYTVVVSDTNNCTDSLSDNIGVDSFKISGKIFRGTVNDTIKKGTVSLIQYVPPPQPMPTIATATINNTGTYTFNCVSPGNYFILAIPDSAQYFSNTFLTYYGDNTIWDSAQILNVSNDVTANIIAQTFGVLPGTGTIEGKVLEGNFSGKTMITGDPIKNINVALITQSPRNSVSSTFTDDSGKFVFKNVDCGKYFVFVDIAGIPQDTSIVMSTVANCDTTIDNILVIVDSTLITVSLDTSANTGINNLSQMENLNILIFPNPTTDETNISFEMQTDNFVSLEVFNLLGQKAADLVNRQLSKGKHNYKFFAKKSELVDGIFIVKIKIGNQTIHKKIIQAK